MSRVEIEYCMPSGYLDRAETIEHAVLVMFGDELDAVTLRPGEGGVFRVTLDGQTIFDSSDDRVDVDEIIRQVRRRL